MGAIQFLLKENVLTDNLLIVPPKGCTFKGNYIAKIKEYVYANSWNDEEKIRMFRSKKQLTKYLDKFYREVSQEFDFTDTALS